MKQKLLQLIDNKTFIIVLFVLFAVIASTQSVLHSPSTYTYEGSEYTRTHYNNYEIFKYSFFHLKNSEDLYTLHLDECWDYFKYTPTFATFFGIFAFMPDWLGLNLWNLLNVLILVLAVYYLPIPENRKKAIALLLCAIELITSIQNAQSNALLVGLLILTYGLLEKDKPFLAALCVVASMYIKLFGVVGALLFLLYPKKWKSALYGIFWTIVFALVPLIFISVSQYEFLMGSYLNLLSADHSNSIGFSVMGWLETWFGLTPNKWLIVGIGAAIMILPLLKIREFGEMQFRYRMLTAILVWIVIFNHKAESPTFIIAMMGVALWFVETKHNLLNISLFVLAIIFTELSPTDIFPRTLRENFVTPYVLKGVPCILVWLKMIYELLIYRHSDLTARELYGPYFEELDDEDQ